MSAGQGHTPGPWAVSDSRISVAAEDGQIAICSPNVRLSSIDSIERMRANARLIAAAPGLLEALHQTPIPGRGEEMMAFRDRQDRWLRGFYNPALAKARGQ